eukprot:1605607-Rhodomonas_salina.3
MLLTQRAVFAVLTLIPYPDGSCTGARGRRCGWTADAGQVRHAVLLPRPVRGARCLGVGAMRNSADGRQWEAIVQPNPRCQNQAWGRSEGTLGGVGREIYVPRLGRTFASPQVVPLASQPRPTQVLCSVHNNSVCRAVDLKHGPPFLCALREPPRGDVGGGRRAVSSNLVRLQRSFPPSQAPCESAYCTHPHLRARYVRRGLPPVEPARKSVVGPGHVDGELVHVRLRDSVTLCVIAPRFGALVSEDGVVVFVSPHCPNPLQDMLAGEGLKTLALWSSRLGPAAEGKLDPGPSSQCPSRE